MSALSLTPADSSGILLNPKKPYMVWPLSSLTLAYSAPVEGPRHTTAPGALCLLHLRSLPSRASQALSLVALQAWPAFALFHVFIFFCNARYPLSCNLIYYLLCFWLLSVSPLFCSLLDPRRPEGCLGQSRQLVGSCGMGRTDDRVGKSAICTR